MTFIRFQIAITAPLSCQGFGRLPQSISRGTDGDINEACG